MSDSRAVQCTTSQVQVYNFIINILLGTTSLLKRHVIERQLYFQYR